MTMIPTEFDLESEIVEATRKAVSELFSQHPGLFYYCALITSGEAHSPYLVAWSEEALAEAITAEENPNEAREELKWSYADSPYCFFGEEHFKGVNDLFSRRPDVSQKEYEIRLQAMERAIAKLDKEGLFGTGAARQRIVVNVEVMPPDLTNTERAIRLNSPEAIKEWLKEAAE